MNEQINDGGPAFPNGARCGDLMHLQGGMTLRDYFAAKAMPAAYADYCASARTVGFDEDWKMGVALDAYAMADAMLAARGPVTADIDAALAAASQAMKESTPSWGGAPAADADGWIEWAGGDCPVPGDTVVDVRFRNGVERGASGADGWDWLNDLNPCDIIAYRIVRAGGAA